MRRHEAENPAPTSMPSISEKASFSWSLILNADGCSWQCLSKSTITRVKSTMRGGADCLAVPGLSIGAVLAEMACRCGGHKFSCAMWVGYPRAESGRGMSEVVL
jgi:hypothetical protein